jgi:hypothetical protein
VEIGVLLLQLRGLLVEPLCRSMNKPGPSVDSAMALPSRQGVGLILGRQGTLLQGQGPLRLSQTIGALGPNLLRQHVAIFVHKVEDAISVLPGEGPKVLSRGQLGPATMADRPWPLGPGSAHN